MSADTPLLPDNLPPEPPTHTTPAEQSEPAAPTAAPIPETAPATSRTHSGVGIAVTLAILISLVVGAAAGVAGGVLGARMVGGSGNGASRTVTVIPSKTTEPVVAASAAAVPSVVNIDVTQKPSSGDNKLPNTHPDVPLQGSGSGVAFKRAPNNGTYILTNNHVVENSQSIIVRDTSGAKHTATLVGTDPDSDIAVVSIDAELPLIPLGDSSKLVVGQTVVAIGSPFGLEHTVTSGVVSALGRSLPDFTTDKDGSYPLVDVIQTDAAINPGNSGGALVDRSGKLIGINTAIYSESGASGGIGFAIPQVAATRVAETLIAGEKVGHPFLGIVGLTITPEVQETRKLTVAEGALVEEITKGTGAAKAGLKPGDVVTALDSERIRSMDDLILQVRRRAVGDKVTITIIRDGKEQKVQMIVGDRPANLDTSTDSSETTPGKE